MSSGIPSDRDLRDSIDHMLFYRRMPPLAELIHDEDHVSTLTSLYRVVRHYMGEPVSVWLCMVFGTNNRITH